METSETNSPSLIKLKLLAIQCDADSSASDTEGNVSVENNISVRFDPKAKKDLVIELTITIKGISKSEEDAFSAKTSWEGLFRLEAEFESELEPEGVEEIVRVCVGKMYSQSRGFIVDILFKMGINVSTIPFEVNIKKQ